MSFSFYPSSIVYFKFKIMNKDLNQFKNAKDETLWPSENIIFLFVQA